MTDLSHLQEDGLKAVSEMPVGDGRKNTSHCRIVKFIDRYHLQVAQETTRHVIATSARGTHCSHEQLKHCSNIAETLQQHLHNRCTTTAGDARTDSTHDCDLRQEDPWPPRTSETLQRHCSNVLIYTTVAQQSKHENDCKNHDVLHRFCFWSIQGRRSIWDRGDTSPQYLDWGTLSRMSPSIFLE